MGLSVGDKTVSEFTVGNTPVKQGADEGNLFRGKNRKTFGYTGSEQSFTAPADGYYILECWGASGGRDNRSNYEGGRGGYAKGKVFLTAGTVLKIYVGGQGKRGQSALTDYAFNGGGRGGFSNYRSINWSNGGGGGGTDIRIGGNTLYHRLIVAGGGGGSSPNRSDSWSCMCGGGEEGDSPVASNKGTQTDGWQFGAGFSSNCNGEGNYYSANGGGGGWYGGGKNCGYNSSASWNDTSWYAGGGSGFVWTGQETVPSGYLVPEDYILSETENIKGNASMPTWDGASTMIGNAERDGYVVIAFSYGSTSEKITQAGIYHNEELGLISMSADGENWITIDDKNAGAWSNDIEDELSYGGYFQFGNSHGFGELPEPEPPEPGYSREPGENTICYFPFLTDALDTQGNRTLTLSGCSVADGALTITGNTQYAQLSSAISNSEITFNMWYCPSAFNGSGSGDWNTILAKAGGTYHHLLISGGNSAEGTVGKIGVWNNAWIGSSKVLTIGQWYNIVVVMNGTNYKLYVDKELVLNATAFDNSAQPVGFVANYNTNGNQGPRGKLSRMIIESGSWSQDDIDNYYEWSKQYYS